MSSDPSVEFTGIRNGETLVHSKEGKQNVGTSMIVYGSYPVSELLSDTDIATRLNGIAFFERMNFNDRKNYLINHSIGKKEPYLNDFDLRIRFLQIGEKFRKDVGSNFVAKYTSINPDSPDGGWPISQVYFDIPKRNPNSRAKRHSLIFRPDIWKIASGVKIATNGYYIDMDIPDVVYGQLVSDFPLIRVENQGQIIELAVKFNSRKMQGDNDAEVLDGIFLPFLSPASHQSYRDFKSFMKDHSPGVMKSFVQKVVRTHCLNVTYEVQGQLVTVDSLAALLASYSLLLVSPAKFDPKLRRTVSGLEMAAKRAGVIIVEDSRGNESVILSMMTSALLRQMDPNFCPDLRHVWCWASGLQYALNSDLIFDYSRQLSAGYIPTSKPEMSKFGVSCLLLKKIGSFKGDIRMFDIVSENNGRTEPEVPAQPRINMPWYHCLDQHAVPDIIYYMLYDAHKKIEDYPSEIWDNVTSWNPRRISHQNHPYVQTSMKRDVIVRVQRLFVARKYQYSDDRFNPRHVRGTGIFYQDHYVLDQSWISGMVGTIIIKTQITENSRLLETIANVVVQTDQIDDLIVVREQPRDADTFVEYDETAKLEIKRVTRQKLESGVKLRVVPRMLRYFGFTREGVLAYFRDGKWFLSDSSNKPHAFEELLNLHISLPEIKLPAFLHHESAMSYHDVAVRIWNNLTVVEYVIYNLNGPAIVEHAHDYFRELLLIIPLAVLHRSIIFLDHYGEFIELFQINHKGKGVHRTTTSEDVGVNHLLYSICLLFPGALKIVARKSRKFEVVTPLLWKIRDIIAAVSVERSHQEYPRRAESGAVWNPLVDNRKRWEHQKSSSKQMFDRFVSGRRGNIVWIPQGLGKTLIICDYFRYKHANGLLNKYIIWTLPPSAIESVYHDLSFFSNVQVVDMTAKGSVQTFQPYMINMISHDHLRLDRTKVQLDLIIGECLFVIDELHKCMSDHTQRSSIAFEYASTAGDFVGLTGTLIRDTRTNILIEWLSRVIDFTVTEENLYVAMSSLVSRRITTKIVVHDEDVEINMLPNELERYQQTFNSTTVNLVQALDICFEAVSRVMVQACIDYLRQGEGCFIVARNVKHQEWLKQNLLSFGLRDDQIFLITSTQSINLTPDIPSNILVVITTTHHVEGYTLTKFRIQLTSAYLVNQTVRDQVNARLNRIGQPSPEIYIYTFVTGILTSFQKRYKQAGKLSASLRALAKELNLEDIDIRLLH